jgi:predicted amidohydrolase
MDQENKRMQNGAPIAVKVAAIQYRAIPADKAENIRRLSALVGEAATNGAKIVVLPELCTTGLNLGCLPDPGTLTEPIPGPTTGAFARLALRYRVYIVLGLAERDPARGKSFNSQVVLGPDGMILGRYRKVHLFGPDLLWAEVGDFGYQCVDTCWGRIGLGICCDINYWELMAFLSHNRVDVLAFSTNWVGEEDPYPYWRAMVAGGGYHLIAANNWGEEADICFTGGSMILAPDGSVTARCESEADGIVCADVERPGCCAAPPTDGAGPGPLPIT